MKIKNIYLKYQIPQNLQEHMIRVAAIGAYLVDNWKDKDEVNRQLVIEALLLHDMGNIIKFDLNKPVLHKNNSNIDQLKKIQKEFIEKYGNDEHDATLAIAQELKISPKVINLLSRKGISSTHTALESSDWNMKIRGYADLRIDPHGVVSVNKRFDDVLLRYKDSKHKLGDLKYVKERRQLAHKLENQIQDKVKVDLQSINSITIQENIIELSNYSYEN